MSGGNVWRLRTMFERLECPIVPALCVEGEECDSPLDEQCGFSISFDKASKQKNVTSFLRNRELLGNRPFSRPRVTYDVNNMETYVRGGWEDREDGYGKRCVYRKMQQMCPADTVRCINDSNIAAVSPNGNFMVRSRIDDDDDRVYDGIGRGTKLLYIGCLAPKYFTWSLSMVLEDIPLSESLCLLFSRKNELVASVLMDTCIEERASRGPQQGVIRVDLLVPWAFTQICSINTACLAHREDRNRKTIEKRCVRVHDRGVVINCGFQIIFITVAPKIIYPLAIAGEVRKTYFFEQKSCLGVVNRLNDAIEKRYDVEVGETLSCRFAVPAAARAHCHTMPTRLEMRELLPAKPITQRLHKHPDIGEPTGPCKLYMARQVVSVESLIAKFLSRWYAVQPKPAKFIGTMDYEGDILSIDETLCSALIGVFVKAEVRYELPKGPEERQDETGDVRRVKTPREKTQFDVVYVEFDWYIIEGSPRNPRVGMRKAAIGNSEIFDKNRWYTGNPRERFEPHEVLQRESTKAVIELQPILQPEMVLRQRSKRNRMNNSQSSFDEVDEEPEDIQDGLEDGEE